jgi:hypothetical protein
MSDASYYKIGLEDSYFKIPVFVKWLVYGGLQALMVYVLSFFMAQHNAVIDYNG